MNIDSDFPASVFQTDLQLDFIELIEVVIPEPSTALLLGLGLIGMAARRKA